jgi:hypothetical protein
MSKGGKKQQKGGSCSATAHGLNTYGSTDSQHVGPDGSIAMKSGGKSKTRKNIFGKLKNMTGRLGRYTMGLIKKTPKFSKRRTSRRR